MSLMIDNPLRSTNRHRANGLRPCPGRGAAAPEPTPATTPGPVLEPEPSPVVSSEIEWADLDDWPGDESEESDDSSEAVPAETLPAPQPVAPTAPLFGGGPAVPPTRTVAPFPPIRAGGGRHRLPTAVRRRPGPIAAGLMVAATTLAVGSLRSPQPPTGNHVVASAQLLAREEGSHPYE